MKKTMQRAAKALQAVQGILDIFWFIYILLVQGAKKFFPGQFLKIKRMNQAKIMEHPVESTHQICINRKSSWILSSDK